MNRIHKIRAAMVTMMTMVTMVLVNIMSVSAAGPDVEAAKSLVRPWIDGLITFMLWLVPGILIVYIARIAIKYLSASEEERQRINTWDKISKGLIIAVVAESIVAIIKIFGFAW